MKLEKLKNNFFQLLGFESEQHGQAFIQHYGLNKIGMSPLELKENILNNRCEKTNCIRKKRRKYCSKHTNYKETCLMHPGCKKIGKYKGLCFIHYSSLY
jgi:hypothetical protein